MKQVTWTAGVCAASVFLSMGPAAAFGPEWEEDNVGDAGRLSSTAQPVSAPGGGRWRIDDG